MYLYTSSFIRFLYTSICSIKFLFKKRMLGVETNVLRKQTSKYEHEYKRLNTWTVYNQNFNTDVEFIQMNIYEI